ncbi:MAG: M23 family metallopeptidase [Spirochaetes bacterium]|nr:M23 family metallopeptidase [Spirochaetota bacterium]
MALTDSKQLFIILFLLLIGWSGVLNAPSLFSVYLKPPKVYKGELLIINLENLNEDNRYQLKVYADKVYEYVIPVEGRFTTFFIGIPLFSPSKIKLELTENNEVIWEEQVSLLEKKSEVSRITVDQKYIEPPKTLTDRLNKEYRLVQKAKATWTDESFFSGKPFFPVSRGEMGTPFGFKRILNGWKKSVHWGVDISVPSGTPVRSIFPGEVILTGDFYFAGRTVFIDHGKGIISMYIHLSEIVVDKDEEVEKGQIIGKVGSTGRSTGPHLHLSVYVNQTPVDPMCLFKTLDEK